MREFSREEIDSVLDLAASLEPYARGKKSDMMAGRILALLFFEPSTRTRMSFETAMKRLGGSVINLGPAEGSSISKGESLADTVRVVAGYSDALVIRHPKEGSARLASQFSPVPVINAGDGAGHHPTQTLLDLYTIKKESRLENLSIALVGDLKYGRTVHSLAYALSLYGADITLVSPPGLRMPEPIKSDLSRKGTPLREASDLGEVVNNVDVLYMTRIQRERFPDPVEYEGGQQLQDHAGVSLRGQKEPYHHASPAPGGRDLSFCGPDDTCPLFSAIVLWSAGANGSLEDAYRNRCIAMKESLGQENGKRKSECYQNQLKEEPKGLKVEPINNGTVIDHIAGGQALNVLKILGISGSTDATLSVVMNVDSRKLGKKDIVKVEERELLEEEVNRIALVAPPHPSTSSETAR